MKLLPETFTGIGEVRGFTFKQLHHTKKGYIYQVNGEHYEVFKRTVSRPDPRFGNTEHRERYPKAHDFGRWAWSCKDFERALDILLSL